MQVVIQPPSLIETGIKVETINNRPGASHLGTSINTH